MRRLLKKLPQVQVKTEFIPFDGGLDIVTPSFTANPSTCRNAINIIQDINGGYSPVFGYERFDGKPKPSAAVYAVLNVTLTGALAVSDVLTDDVGTSFGTVIAIETGYVVLTKITGAFTTGNIKVGAGVVGTCEGGQIIDGAQTPKLAAYYKNLAADAYRADIAAVPGSGAVLGVVTYKDVVYAFRNAVDGLSAAMYKSTATGWSAVTLGRELAFTSGGTHVITAGETITGEVGGATAVITRVILTSGSWAAGDAVGRLIFASQTGAFQAETIKVGASLDVATIAGNSSAISFAIPSGTFEFVVTNFTGSTDTSRLYGVDGKNRGWEFDGTVFVPISTGMTADTPEHICEHKYHLFYSFLGSVQHSSPGDPYDWSVITGAGEIALGEQVSGFASQPGTDGSAALSIFTRNTISMLYGSAATGDNAWSLIPYKKEAGAYSRTVQSVGNTYMLDDRGIVMLSTSQNYGNFADATVSKPIQPWLKVRRILATASCVMRDLNLYLLFFSDGYGLAITIDDGKVRAMLPLLFPDVVRGIHSSELTTGEEAVFFGDSNGYVYELAKGTSFDGDAITWNFDLAYNHLKSPNRMKRFRSGVIEAEGEGYCEFQFSYDLDYASVHQAQPDPVTEISSLTPANWDLFVWDAFFWDGTSLSPTRMSMAGSGANISLKFAGSSDYFNQIRFSGALLQFSPTRDKR